MKISIIGLGWFGSSLAERLKPHHEILGTTRSEEKVFAHSRTGITAELLLPSGKPSSELMSADVIVLNIPPFQDQLKWFRSWKWSKETHLVFISSTSVYGDEDGEISEEDNPKPNTENGHILVSEEEWVKTFPNYTIIRFGGLIGKARHPGKFLSGRKNLSGGNQPVNLIHLDDTVGFTELVINKKLYQETFNLVNPEHPTRREYYQSFCLSHNLPVPEFVDSKLPGKIISQKKVLKIYQHQVKLRNS